MLKRYNNIDALKALCAFLVICIHCPFPGLAGEYVVALSRIAVPIFFMITGYFYKPEENPEKRQIIKLLKIILLASVLYFSWNLIIGITKFAADGKIDSISEVFGIFALIVAGVFVIVGLVQLIRRKNLKLVDNHILALGVFYVVVAMAYIFFEVLVVNHRPVLAQGVLEASYPSSHTMLSICILSSAIIEFHKFFDGKKKQLIALDTISIVIMLVIVIGRLLSGMHWFTDIIGGILLSFALVFLYHGILKIIEKRIEIKNNKA